MNEQQNELYRILLMPIEENEINGYRFCNEKIYSGYSYGRRFDADMSNVAIRFYSLLYGIKEEDILSTDKRWVKGDTMNSSLLYYRPNAEKKKEWDEKKHCLANFWLLPMNIGRTPVRFLSRKEKSLCKHSKISRLHDYMDNFLLFIGENYNEYYDVYDEYFKKLNIEKNSFTKSFSKVHFLNKGYYLDDSVKVVDKQQLKGSYDVWMRMIENRAYEIASSDIWKLLYDNLINENK